MKKLVLFSLAILSCSNSVAAEDVNTDSLSQISNQVIQTAQSFNFPNPRIKELGVVSYTLENPASVSYGHYRVDEVRSGLAQVSTAATHNFRTEDVTYNLFLKGFLDEEKTLEHKIQSSGSGVSVGGLIELFTHTKMNMDTSNDIRLLPAGFSHSMTIESKVTKLKIVSGQLFPLKVGNKILIKKTSEASIGNDKGKTTTLEFEVTKQIGGYLLNNSELPGDVFEIALHTEQSRKGITPPSIFIFSSHLGWVVESHVGKFTQKAVGWN